MEQKQIYKALTSIIAEVSAIGKNQKNQQQGFMFRGIDDVMNELHTLFGKYKVAIIPEVVSYEVREHTTTKGTLIYTTHTTVKFHFVAEDGSEVVTTNVGEAMDTADKGMNKTMSCALKYSLMQMFLIPTKDIEDADRTTPEETKPKKKDVPAVLKAIKDATTIEQLQLIQDTAKKRGCYEMELREGGMIYNAIINRTLDLNK
jgi:DNA replication protein DnaD